MNEIIFEVSLKINIDGKEAKVTGQLYDNDHAIQVNGVSQGGLSYVNGEWTSKNSLLAPVAGEIIKNFNQVKIKFKWNLPDSVRKHILWAKYILYENKLIIGISDKIPFDDFETSLKEALFTNNICPDVNIQLTCPRTLGWHSTGYFQS